MSRRKQGDSPAAVRERLRKKYPYDDGTTIDLPKRLTSVVDEWRALKEETKALDDQITALENEIKEHLGTAARGELPNGDAVTWTSFTMPPRAAVECRALRYFEAK